MGGDYIMHFLTLPWKLIFAFVPPTAIYNGYVTFVISILFIGGCTAVIGDIASHLGCFIFLKDGVNAIAFVALGTSVPDTFASKTAAIEDETADASVGNVTGSNAVNVSSASASRGPSPPSTTQDLSKENSRSSPEVWD